jgi:hypothetical protein
MPEGEAVSLCHTPDPLEIRSMNHDVDVVCVSYSGWLDPIYLHHYSTAADQPIRNFLLCKWLCDSFKSAYKRKQPFLKQSVY